MAVTIKDIAKKTGVTIAAVSKALNDKPDIGDKLKEKIRKVAKELGYKKNILARRLVTQKSNTIGVFLFSRGIIGNATESSAFKYIITLLEETAKYGYDIVLFSFDSDLKHSQSYIDLCQERQVEGLIIIGLDEKDPHIKEISASPIPVVLIEKTLTGENVRYVNSNNRKGVRLALTYLLELGHTRIGFVSGYKDSAANIERYNTFKNYLSRRKIFNPELVFEGNFTMESGYEAGKKISTMKERPTAIFAACDLIAIGLIRALIEDNIRIPDDISIIGYDNFEFGKYYTPKLTTIAQDFQDIAQKAIMLLFKMINNDEEILNLMVEPKLIIRESCREC